MRKKRREKPMDAQDADVLPVVLPEQPGRESFIAGPCNMCVSMLAILDRKQNTYVTDTRGRVRYCKCRNCGHTWKVVS